MMKVIGSLLCRGPSPIGVILTLGAGGYTSLGAGAEAPTLGSGLGGADGAAVDVRPQEPHRLPAVGGEKARVVEVHRDLQVVGNHRVEVEVVHAGLSSEGSIPLLALYYHSALSATQARGRGPKPPPWVAT